MGLPGGNFKEGIDIFSGWESVQGCKFLQMYFIFDTCAYECNLNTILLHSFTTIAIEQ